MLVNPLKKNPKPKGETLLTVGVGCLYGLQLIAEHPDFWVFTGLGAIYVALSSQKWVSINKKQLWVIRGLIMIPLLLNLWANPSHAAFLTQDFYLCSANSGNSLNQSFNCRLQRADCRLTPYY